MTTEDLLEQGRIDALKLRLTRHAVQFWREFKHDATWKLVEAAARAEWGEHTSVVLDVERVVVENFDGRNEIL